LSKSISAFEGNVERDSNINWMTCDLGALFAKTTLNSKLKESGASTTQYGLFFGRNDQKYDIHMHSEHIGKNTNSKLHVIGALDGKSKAVSRGFIKIREGASNSEGFQEEETLLLSEKAEASAVPYLEIDNNDVRCSHATSIGQLDEDAIFYSMTRGLSKNEAKKLQVGGFFDAFVQKMEPEFAKDIRKLIDGKVEEINDS
ncbi:MAG: SufD family Fe-S cluster assembly protein, partial [archaeon]|nr:SufD family Fe-S cluster assembly protein [archaeon]